MIAYLLRLQLTVLQGVLLWRAERTLLQIFLKRGWDDIKLEPNLFQDFFPPGRAAGKDDSQSIESFHVRSYHVETIRVMELREVKTLWGRI